MIREDGYRKYIAYSIAVSTPDCLSEGAGSIPAGAVLFRNVCKRSASLLMEKTYRKERYGIDFSLFFVIEV